MERMERDKIAKKVYVGECVGNRSVGGPFGCQASKENDAGKE